MPPTLSIPAPSKCATVVYCALLLLLPRWSAAAEPTWSYSFDGLDTVWQVRETQTKASVVSHECVPGGARDQAGVEKIVVAAAAGDSVQLICPVTDVAVMDELTTRVWVKSSIPGVKLGARVVLPRAPAADGGAPMTVVVFGQNYDRHGHWQQIVLNDVPKLLAAELRILRLTAGSQLDSREAYLDSVVLSVPGDPRGVEVVTDELTVDGVPRAATENLKLANYPVTDNNAGPTLPAAPAAATLRRLPNFGATVPEAAKEASVRIQGDLLVVNEKPFSPRVIDWQGEPLQFLAERGFNVVRLAESPTAEQSAEASRRGLWFISRAPRPDTVDSEGLGKPSDRILGWHIEDLAIESDPHYARRWAEVIRARDIVAGRPVILEPPADWTSASLFADVLIARRDRCGIVAAHDYERWLVSEIQTARPGSAIWANLPTQFDPAVGRQVSALTGTPTPPPRVDLGQLEKLLHFASISGVRGFVFASHSSLQDADAATRRRAAAVELVNRRLQLIEPWLAGGKAIGRIASADATWTGAILHVDRARLLLPFRSVTDAVAPSQQSSATDTAFIVPGIPESSQVFALSPAALKTLPTQRVAGGIRFALKPDDQTYVLITEDPKVIQAMRQQIAAGAARYVQLLRESAAWQSASQAAAQQRQQVVPPAVLLSNPLMLGDEHINEYVVFQRSVPGMQRGDNLLYGGDFEDLGQMTQAGWQHIRNPSAGAESRAELATAEPRHGRSCLLLQNSATATGVQASHHLPMWIQSPAMPIAEPTWLEITGWVRVDAPTAAGDGLQITDTLGGPDLALSLGTTAGWQRFQMIRAATEPAELRVNFALGGSGTARVDAVMVRTLKQSAAPTSPTAIGPVPILRPLPSTGPLLVAPQTR